MRSKGQRIINRKNIRVRGPSSSKLTRNSMKCSNVFSLFHNVTTKCLDLDLVAEEAGLRGLLLDEGVADRLKYSDFYISWQH